MDGLNLDGIQGRGPNRAAAVFGFRLFGQSRIQQEHQIVARQFGVNLGALGWLAEQQFQCVLACCLEDPLCGWLIQAILLEIVRFVGNQPIGTEVTCRRYELLQFRLFGRSPHGLHHPPGAIV